MDIVLKRMSSIALLLSDLCDGNVDVIHIIVCHLKNVELDDALQYHIDRFHLKPKLKSATLKYSLQGLISRIMRKDKYLFRNSNSNNEYEYEYDYYNDDYDLLDKEYQGNTNSSKTIVKYVMLMNAAKTEKDREFYTNIIKKRLVKQREEHIQHLLFRKESPILPKYNLFLCDHK